jgi:hypothetical protein
MKKQAVTGPELYAEDRLAPVETNREVSMAADILRIPQILQLGEIGPTKLLKSPGNQDSC